jgi:hypothetical protein
MRRRIVIAGVIAWMPARGWAAGPTNWLVTPEEVRASRAQGQTRGGILAVPQGDGPEIRVERPDGVAPLHPPVSFRIKFVSRPGVAINVGSFHASYGFFGVDITTRLLKQARLTPDGLSADNLDIPPGDHKVTLAIADTAGHVTSETFRFTVV